MADGVTLDHATISNYINGEWTPARSGRTAQNVNPATSESLGDVVVSGREEADAAALAAKAAFAGWKKTPAPRRGEILARAAELMSARREQLAAALTLEEGK